MVGVMNKIIEDMVYTDSELKELKKVVDDITTHIPKDKASYILEQLQ